MSFGDAHHVATRAAHFDRGIDLKSANPVIFPADVSPGSISRDNNPFNSSPDARRPRVGLAMRALLYA